MIVTPTDSSLGGYPGNDDDGRTMMRERDRDEMLEDFVVAIRYLQAHEQCSGKAGLALDH